MIAASERRLWIGRPIVFEMPGIGAQPIVPRGEPPTLHHRDQPRGLADARMGRALGVGHPCELLGNPADFVYRKPSTVNSIPVVAGQVQAHRRHGGDRAGNPKHLSVTAAESGPQAIGGFEGIQVGFNFAHHGFVFIWLRVTAAIPFRQRNDAKGQRGPAQNRRRIAGVSTAEQNRSKGRRKTGLFSVMRYAVLRVVPLVHRRAPRCFA